MCLTAEPLRRRYYDYETTFSDRHDSSVRRAIKTLAGKSTKRQAWVISCLVFVRNVQLNVPDTGHIPYVDLRNGKSAVLARFVDQQNRPGRIWMLSLQGQLS